MTHAVNHWIRVEALAIFHEGEFSAGEIADMLGEDVKNVRAHIKDLYDSGCIEFAGTKMIDGYARPVYRAIVLPVVTDEVAGEFSAEEQRDVAGAIVQGFLTESVSSFRNGKMDTDREICLIWDAPHLDAKGEKEMLAHLIRSWKGVQKIHVKSTNRMAKSGEKGATSVVSLMGFRRGRGGRPEGGYWAEKNEK